MPDLRFRVPTYHGDVTDSTARAALPEFGDPAVPVVIRCASGVRVVLGSIDFSDMSAPDVLIERHPRGWAIFLHPAGGGDPSGAVYFLDDGRSFAVAEEGAHPIRMAESTDELPELDSLAKPNRSRP